MDSVELARRREQARNGAASRLDWFWPMLVAATIFLASGTSRVAGPHITGFDKISHFFVYGLLATLLVRIPRLARARLLGALLAVVLTSLYGVSDEIHQMFTPGRSADWIDWMVDTAGAALAVAVYCRWPTYRQWLEHPLLSMERRATASPIASDFIR